MRGLCVEARCPEPPVYRGRCRLHSRQRDKSINRAGRQLYNTKRWQLTRRRKLFDTPLCEAEGCTEIATDVHHRIDLADGGAPYDLANLEALCHSHHSQVTRAGQLAGKGRVAR